MSGGINKESTIKRTGELMLSGWRLLSTMCPICNTALLSKAESVRCPGCDLPVKIAGADDFFETSTLPLPPPPPEIQKPVGIDVDRARELMYNSIPDTQRTMNTNTLKTDGTYQADSINSDDGMLEVDPDLLQMRADFDIKNKRMNDVSGKLGQKMLSGWCMLGEVCPKSSCRGTPLMQRPGNPAANPKLCVACDGEFIASSYGDLVQINDQSSGKSATQQATHTTTVPSTSAAVDGLYYRDASNAPILEPETTADQQLKLSTDKPTPSALAKGGDKIEEDPSLKISEFLMKGWALLDSCCVSKICEGNVPLMRNPSTKKVQCVHCGYIEGSAAAVDSRVAPPAASVDARDVDLEEGDSDDDDNLGDNDDIDEQLMSLYQEKLRSYTSQSKRQRVSEAFRATSAPPMKKEKPGHISAGSDVQSFVQKVLQKKLKSTAEALDKSTSVASSIQLTELIIKLTEALEKAL